MKSENVIKFEMTQENYIDHELRILMVEQMYKQLIGKINMALIAMGLFYASQVILPIIFYFLKK